MVKLLLSICFFSIALAAPKRKQQHEWYPPGGRVIGGVDARIEDFPYIVSVNVKGEHWCGASLISDTWAVTAGHCLDGHPLKDVVVQANSSLIDTGVIVGAKTLIVHPALNYSTKDGDVGLIELTEPLNCTYCKPIALSKVGPVVGRNVTLAGWGIWDPDYAENNDESMSPVLQTAQVPVIDRDQCNAKYAVIYESITENMFCAGLLGVGGVDACSGDSGGPVVQDGKLVGSVSWSHGCALPNFPGVHALFTRYLDWIKTNSGISP